MSVDTNIATQPTITITPPERDWRASMPSIHAIKNGGGSRLPTADIGDPSGFLGKDGFSFKTFLDVINPLQHIPVVSTIYRAVTGDEISPAAQLAGGALFGGPVGLAFAVGNAAISSATGKTPTEAVLASASKPAQPSLATATISDKTRDGIMTPAAADQAAARAADQAQAQALKMAAAQLGGMDTMAMTGLPLKPEKNLGALPIPPKAISTTMPALPASLPARSASTVATANAAGDPYAGFEAAVHDWYNDRGHANAANPAAHTRYRNLQKTMVPARVQVDKVL